MKISRFVAAWAIAFLVAFTGPAHLTASAAQADVNTALGAWLPDPNTGFEAWRKGQTAVINKFDYFVCGAGAAPTEAKQSLSYAGSACKALTNGTPFSYGPAGPNKGRAVYDRAHDIVLYSKGCCAERGVALTANLGKPPSAVSGADLSGVRTMRGVSLGMTQTQVTAIYGTAQSHATNARPGIATLSYTTMKGTPTDSKGDSCGQFQSFSFRGNRLVSIELLAGC